MKAKAAVASGVNLVLSFSRAGTTLVNAGNRHAAAGPLISVLQSRLRTPVSLEKLASPSSVGFVHEILRIFRTARARTELTAMLVSVAERAYALYRWDVLEFIGDLLVELAGTRQAIVVGRYYQALSINRSRSGDTEAATPLFEMVAQEGPPRYRARALIAVGNRLFSKQDHIGAQSIYREAIHVISSEGLFDAITFFIACKNMAVARAVQGDHRGSLEDLETLLPLARMAASIQPHLYYDYLNGLAVELGEEGRLEEARRVSSFAVASPFAGMFPAYQETFDEIAAKLRKASRSLVTVPSDYAPSRRSTGEPQKRRAPASQAQPTNILLLRTHDREPAAESSDQVQTRETARVLNFHQWKAQTVTPAHLLPGKLAPEQRAMMTTGEKLIRLMDLISRDETDDEMIDRILDSVEAIVLSREEKLD